MFCKPRFQTPITSNYVPYKCHETKNFFEFKLLKKILGVKNWKNLFCQLNKAKKDEKRI